ncbi:2-aminoethylphosphonate aminotransferase [Paenibacillus campi]|uniref:2-aminoethylphosphonate aminotransferase n=1 Tax=Paenibacillus campi TaxID=3106031 RepID=UPI002AFEC757|nr:2-aminoethylphosphonate--pyruvate transaminase [Paenibacillus sp. SGZ-1009]
MVKTAVILAAGLGSRLKEQTTYKPKGFLQIDGCPIVERSIQLLRESGIQQIWIGTGYLAEHYEQLAQNYDGVGCVYNEKYSESGSMYTLYQLRAHLNEDFLLLESDLLYDRAALLNIQADSRDDIVLASGKTESGDEVYIETDEDGCLVALSKRPEVLNRVDAELVGIARISSATYRSMCRWAEQQFAECLNVDYEHALVAASRQKPIAVNKIEALIWCEIDDAQHLQRAQTIIYPQIKARETETSSSGIKRNILLNPGPATTTDTVKLAQVVPDICPREQQFGQLMNWITTQLTAFVASPHTYDTVLFGGSGTAAVEAVIASVIGEGKLLIVSNGAYGERMAEIAAVYRLHVETLHSSPIEPLDLERIERALIAGEFTHVAVVHHETTSGILNDIDAIGQLCSQYKAELIVDAMSSYGAVPIRMKESCIDYLISSSNKNLQGMAGISFVIAPKAKLEQSIAAVGKSYYLNLYKQYAYFKQHQQMRFTPPVQTLYALKQAVVETQIEGIERRYERYTQSWTVLIEGLNELGLRYIVPLPHQSHLITAIAEPTAAHYHFNELHDYLYERGITIYPGKIGKLASFRIANIGDIDQQDMRLFIKHLQAYMALIK